METKEIIIKLVIWVVGMVISFGMYKVSQLQIKTRCEKIPSLAKNFSPELLNSKKSLIIWELVYAILLALAVLFCANPVRLALAVIFIICGMNIAAVDLAIRRIPNELLITIMVSSLICNILECVLYKSKDDLKQTIIFILVGFVGAFIIYLIPKKFGVYIGNGDIKLSAVIGFALGIVGYLQAMILMAVFMLVYLAILLITKQGGLKTKAPMGPALSFGAIISIIFPVLVNNI